MFLSVVSPWTSSRSTPSGCSDCTCCSSSKSPAAASILPVAAHPDAQWATQQARQVAATGYGIPMHDPAAFPYLWIKGIRDVFSGLVVLPFLWHGDRRTTATLYALSIFVPFGDGLVILRDLGFAPPIFIHWGTTLYMMIVAAFLFRKQKTVEGLS